jgi:hypothetical protein
MLVKTNTILNEFRKVETDLLLTVLFHEWDKQFIAVNFICEVGLITCYYDYFERRFIALKLDEQIVKL